MEWKVDSEAPLPHQRSKLVFVGLCRNYLSLRTSAHAGVAIPPMNGTR